MKTFRLTFLPFTFRGTSIKKMSFETILQRPRVIDVQSDDRHKVIHQFYQKHPNYSIIKITEV